MAQQHFCDIVRVKHIHTICSGMLAMHVLRTTTSMHNAELYVSAAIPVPDGQQDTHLLRMYVYSKVIYAHFECRSKTTQAKEATSRCHKVLAGFSVCDRCGAQLAGESASCSSTGDAAGPDQTPLTGIKPAIENKNCCGWDIDFCCSCK